MALFGEIHGYLTSYKWLRQKGYGIDPVSVFAAYKGSLAKKFGFFACKMVKTPYLGTNVKKFNN